MKIGVVSDSHGSIGAIRKAAQMAGKLDLWLHAGDYVQDAVELENLTGTKVIKVAGNGDWMCPDIPEDEYIYTAGKKIWLTHGHKYQVKWGVDILREMTADNKADIIIYGHSHVYSEKRVNTQLFLNPGSVALPRDGKYGSFAIIEISENKNFIELKKYLMT